MFERTCWCSRTSTVLLFKLYNSEHELEPSATRESSEAFPSAQYPFPSAVARIGLVSASWRARRRGSSSTRHMRSNAVMGGCEIIG